MKLKRKPIKTVYSADETDFEDQCQKLYEDDYKIISSSVGFVNSKYYEFCSTLQAIFKDKLID